MKQGRSNVDLLLFRIAVHGPGIVYRHTAMMKDLYRREATTFREVSWALEEAGMPREDVLALVTGRHARSCACWRCVMQLRMVWEKLLVRSRVEQWKQQSQNPNV